MNVPLSETFWLQQPESEPSGGRALLNVCALPRKSSKDFFHPLTRDPPTVFGPLLDGSERIEFPVTALRRAVGQITKELRVSCRMSPSSLRGERRPLQIESDSPAMDWLYTGISLVVSAITHAEALSHKWVQSELPCYSASANQLSKNSWLRVLFVCLIHTPFLALSGTAKFIYIVGAAVHITSSVWHIIVVDVTNY
jgi:hypothetical protein